MTEDRIGKIDFTVTPRLFKALLNLDGKTISTLSLNEIRPALPCLVRMSLITPFNNGESCSEDRMNILTILSSIDAVNAIIALLSIDFHSLEIDVKQEQILREKIGSGKGESVLLSSNQNSNALEFERGDSTRRLRIALYEILYVAAQVQEQQSNANASYVVSSELFDHEVYIPEICDVINILISELPSLFSIPELTQILLHVNHGPDIICWIVCNFPDYFHDVSSSLISNSEKIEDENGGFTIRFNTLIMLCTMFPQSAYLIREKCVNMTKLPALTITLTLKFPESFVDEDYDTNNSSGDILAFLSSILLGSDQTTRTWFSNFAKSKNKQPKEVTSAISEMRAELCRQLEEVVNETHDSYLPYDCVVHSTVLLKLYCALRSIVGIKFIDVENSLLLKLTTCYPPATTEGVRFAAVALCTMFACPSITSASENEAVCVHWLKWLSSSESPFFGRPTDITASFSEMLLLLAIHVHSGQLGAVTDLVCTTLGMKLSLRNHYLSKLKTAFVQEIFTEQVVTARAINVLVTPNLNANMRGFLPVHCIHQLMKSRAFSKHKVNVKDWIYKQICASAAPVHPFLPPLIEVYVNSMLTVVNPKAPYECSVNDPISEEEITNVFFGPSQRSGSITTDEKLTPQLLLLYYILLYEDVRLNNSQGLLDCIKEVKCYTAEFLSEFPIKYLFQRAQKDQRNYSGIFPSLLRLLITHFPHLVLVEDWLDEDEPMLPIISYKPITKAELIIGLESMLTCPSQVLVLMDKLMAMRPTEVWPYVSIIMKYFRQTLDERVPRKIQEAYKKVWLKLNAVLPRTLWVMTIKALLHEEAIIPLVSRKQEKIIIDPLQILRCDQRVYRCAPVLSIVIRVLQSSLAASRSQLNRHLLDKPLIPLTSYGGFTCDSEREELKSALIAAQESAAVQILLEVCVKTDIDGISQESLWSLREVRSLVSTYIHQVFIAYPPIAKLVHFQGYPQEILESLVKGIPSMHICADFVSQLISQPSLEKQVFAIDLISHLSLQYALPHSMMVARLALNTLATLLTVLPIHSCVELFLPSLPALVRMCESFSPLTELTISLLSDLGRVCASEASLELTTPHFDMLSDFDDVTSSHSAVSISYLGEQVDNAFTAIVTNAVLKSDIY